MACDRFLELLAIQLDGALTGDEEREMEEHLALCPDCRAEQSRLAAMQAAFDELEDVEVPEGFAQGVMDRIRAEKKVIPLRPQFKALAGMAACAVLVVGLYGAVQPQKDAGEEGLRARSFEQEMLDEDMDIPRVAAYSASDEMVGSAETIEGAGEYREMQKSVPDAAVTYDGMSAVEPEHDWFRNDQYLRVTYGDTPEPGARIIGNAQSLEDFLTLFSSDNLSQLTALTAQYGEGYFVSERLLAVVVEEPSGSIRHQISGLLWDQVIIEQTSPYCTEDMAAWLILAEVDSTFNDGDELSVTVIPWEDNTDS